MVLPFKRIYLLNFYQFFFFFGFSQSFFEVLYIDRH